MSFPERSGNELFPDKINTEIEDDLTQCTYEEIPYEEVFQRPTSRPKLRPRMRMMLEGLAITGVVGGLALILTPLAVVALPASAIVAVGIGCLLVSSFAVVLMYDDQEDT